MWAKQSHIWDLWFICEGGLLKWVLFSPLIIKQSDHAIWRSERYELTQLRMWIIRCKSQSRTYSCNFFVLLWSEEVAFYLKCFQKTTAQQWCTQFYLDKILHFQGHWESFSQVCFLPAKQLSFHVSANLCESGNFGVVHSAYRKGGAQGRGESLFKSHVFWSAQNIHSLPLGELACTAGGVSLSIPWARSLRWGCPGKPTASTFPPSVLPACSEIGPQALPWPLWSPCVVWEGQTHPWSWTKCRKIRDRFE